jgi:peptidoglycan/LPS O-acetylase OafA/YrhL
VVLALPAMRATPKPFAFFYARFMTLRIFRIDPAFWFALLVSLVASALYVPSNGNTLFWNSSPWEIPRREMLHYFLLIPNFHAALIDGPTWTLTVEIQMSSFCPCSYSYSGTRYALGWPAG